MSSLFSSADEIELYRQKNPAEIVKIIVDCVKSKKLRFEEVINHDVLMSSYKIWERTVPSTYFSYNFSLTNVLMPTFQICFVGEKERIGYLYILFNELGAICLQNFDYVSAQMCWIYCYIALDVYCPLLKSKNQLPSEQDKERKHQSQVWKHVKFHILICHQLTHLLIETNPFNSMPEDLTKNELSLKSKNEHYVPYRLLFHLNQLKRCLHEQIVTTNESYFLTCQNSAMNAQTELEEDDLLQQRLLNRNPLESFNTLDIIWCQKLFLSMKLGFQGLNDYWTMKMLGKPTKLVSFTQILSDTMKTDIVVVVDDDEKHETENIIVPVVEEQEQQLQLEETTNKPPTTTLETVQVYLENNNREILRLCRETVQSANDERDKAIKELQELKALFQPLQEFFKKTI